MSKTERSAMADYATKHHGEHDERDSFCRKCAILHGHDYGRGIGMMPRREDCCAICRQAARRRAIAAYDETGEGNGGHNGNYWGEW